MTLTDGPDPRRRLAELMDDRRIELDLAWEEVARRAGMTGMSLRRIRKDETVLSRRAAAKIDRALEWQPGSVEGILSGGEPVPPPGPEPAADPLLDPTYLRQRQRLQELWREHGEHEGLLLFIQEVEAEAATTDKSMTSDRGE